MDTPQQTTTLSIEERVSRLEGALGWAHAHVPLKDSLFTISAVALGLALLTSLKGLGVPNHYYQLVFAVLIVILSYHRGWFATPTKHHHWTLAVLNVLVLTVVLKLLIGLGEAHPLAWIKVPAITSEQAAQTSDWIPTLPKLSIAWENSSVTGWVIDLTIIQTFLLLLTLISALFEFQPFSSLSAFLLILLSIPALITFDWPWVFWGIILTSVAFYLQTAGSNVE